MSRVVIASGTGVVLAATASVFFLLFDSYSGRTCYTTGNGTTSNCVSSGSTFVEQNGDWSIIFLLTPTFFALLVFLMTLPSAGALRRVSLVPAILLLLFCGIAIFEVGFFYLPAAIACIAATVLDHRAAERQS